MLRRRARSEVRLRQSPTVSKPYFTKRAYSSRLGRPGANRARGRPQRGVAPAAFVSHEPAVCAWPPAPDVLMQAPSSAAGAASFAFDMASAGADVAAAALHDAPWSISDVFWDAEACAGLLAPPAPAGAPLLPRPPPAGCGGSGGPAASPAPRAAPSAPSPPAEREARCQVAGCEAPLRDLGRYYVRNRLCTTHVRAAEMTLTSGAVVRFCQVRARRSRRPALPRLPAPAGARRAARRAAFRVARWR